MSRRLTSATTLDNLKKEAKRWLRALRAGDAPARERLRRAHPAAPEQPGLRDVQLALAREYGLPGWAALKDALAEAARNSEEATRPPEALMYVPRMSAVLSRWFTSYDEARAAREAEGGFLLPFKNQFFVTTGEAIRELGLDPDDPDWERIGWDWVRPRDQEAWERLRARRRSAI